MFAWFFVHFSVQFERFCPKMDAQKFELRFKENILDTMRTRKSANCEKPLKIEKKKNSCKKVFYSIFFHCFTNRLKDIENNYPVIVVLIIRFIKLIYNKFYLIYIFKY
uniref:Uncharacterized protein n=1 Tax=Heterorhabditis bacteriophora TaxID=37862 RepID=A0A1I7WKX7_HETBA